MPRRRSSTSKPSLYRPSDFRRIKEPATRLGVGLEAYRSPVRRDYARIIHCAAFRRLQGKTQVFPGHESDFFRNRLTHSLEVAQIAKSISFRLNAKIRWLHSDPIIPDFCEVAGLVHDIGHPPFGHNGEKALDDCMKKHGGFEGNAQTMRILTRLEKKEALNALPIGIDKKGRDLRLGLNLTPRSLAAAFKYDKGIPSIRPDGADICKGYYLSEEETIRTMKQRVDRDYSSSGKFKTLECSIMDIADDIAYSTYDLEDSFKAEFLTPLDMISADETILKKVSEKVSDSLGERIGYEHVVAILITTFRDFFRIGRRAKKLALRNAAGLAYIIADIYRSQHDLARYGYMRTDFTSDLISEFIAGIEVRINKRNPAMSQAFLRDEVLIKVEVLKHFTFEATIMSSRLKVAEFRGYEIVKGIFNCLNEDKGALLLPSDFREVYERFRTADEKKRVICDFIAGMTDRYALEFYGRLFSESPQSLFKPI